MSKNQNIIFRTKSDAQNYWMVASFDNGLSTSDLQVIKN